MDSLITPASEIAIRQNLALQEAQPCQIALAHKLPATLSTSHLHLHTCWLLRHKLFPLHFHTRFSAHYRLPTACAQALDLFCEIKRSFKSKLKPIWFEARPCLTSISVSSAQGLHVSKKNEQAYFHFPQLYLWHPLHRYTLLTHPLPSCRMRTSFDSIEEAIQQIQNIVFWTFQQRCHFAR